MAKLVDALLSGGSAYYWRVSSSLISRTAKPDGFPPGFFVLSAGGLLGPETVATLGHVRGRGPLDTSSAKQDEVDCGRDGAKRKVSGADSSGTNT